MPSNESVNIVPSTAGWLVHVDGARAAKFYSTKEEAIEAGLAGIVAPRKPSALLVHDEGGKIVEIIDFEGLPRSASKAFSPDGTGGHQASRALEPRGSAAPTPDLPALREAIARRLASEAIKAEIRKSARRPLRQLRRQLRGLGRLARGIVEHA